MKYIAILLCCCSLTVCFNEEYGKKLTKITEECQKNPATQASDEWLKTEPVNVNLEGEGSHIFCRLKLVGSLKENGDIDKEAMEKDLSSGISDSEIVKTLVEKCGTRTPGSSPEKSAIDNFRCIILTYEELTN